MSEPTNEDRADWAENAVNAFGLETYCGRSFTSTVKEQPKIGDDAYTMCQDLICDILHLATLHNWPPHDMVRRALECYDEEMREAGEHF